MNAIEAIGGGRPLPAEEFARRAYAHALNPARNPLKEILDKAVQYILHPSFGTQNAKHAFLLEEVGLSSTEYLECLNRATNGGVVKAALWT